MLFSYFKITFLEFIMHLVYAACIILEMLFLDV